MKRFANLVERLLAEKKRLAASIESRLDPREAEEARRDHHARRRPIPCGMTIHTGVGCNFGCLYCYVPDMGFPLKPRPYPLSGLQLVYALLNNPYFVPGPRGTLLAFGSVTEPFMPETVDRALEYLEETWRHLRNPQQISTKSVLDGERLERFVKSSDPRINVLITITTLRYAHMLEPGAPSPDERLRFAAELARRGVSVTLFLRPIVPGVTDRELEDIIRRAREAGIRTMVPGSLRVTPGILRRLGASGIVDIKVIEERLPRNPRGSRDQVTLRESDLKELAARIAARYGLRVLPSSCSANIVSHGLGCWACKWGPCGHAPPRPQEGEVAEAAEVLGCRRARASVKGNTIYLVCNGDRRLADIARVWIETITKFRTVARQGR
ncbi:DNA photolyase [Pyrodictium occultum]|uniref:DNA photolyase n=1 Tax=Pyrodictium occultum TaxID=2309 RepID=A0A0V8RW00_PYROC|nr:radical SAM protein [Pyrodictium occultum]KSW12251.1 DNA photolyase [Pyrodictium occultum]